MAVVEIQTPPETLEPPKAANSRFFISPEHQTAAFVTSLIADLGAISIRSKLAQTELRDVISDEVQADYRKKLAELASGRGNEDTIQLVGYMQGISEEANGYSDAVATIRHAGTDLAERLKVSLGQRIKVINNHPYWVADDRSGHSQFFGQVEEDVIIFGVVAYPCREEGREAGFEDYIQLITDVESELAVNAT